MQPCSSKILKYTFYTTKWYNKIKVSCSRNQQNVTLHIKHDHQYRRNFKSLNIIWYIVCFFLHLLRRLIFFSRNTSSILHVEYKALWVRDCLCFTPYKYIMHRLSVTLRNYQPVAWVLYQRVIDQSKFDIFIKPGIIIYILNHISNLFLLFIYCYVKSAFYKRISIWKSDIILLPNKQKNVWQNKLLIFEAIWLKSAVIIYYTPPNPKHLTDPD